MLEAIFRTYVRKAYPSPRVRNSWLKRAQVIRVGTHDVLAAGQTPVEFTFQGKSFRIYSALSRWCETGGRWNRFSECIYRSDDGARALWRVEAAPIGAVTHSSICVQLGPGISVLLTKSICEVKVRS